MLKKIVISAGGTGGHIYPALSLANQLSQSDLGASILFIGGKLTSNPFFENSHFSHITIPCGNFNSKNPYSCLKSCKAIMKGVWESKKAMNAFQPDLVVGFGSYYTLPTLLAAKLSHIPFILHEANYIPGKVNRLLSRYAKATGIHFPETASYIKGHAIEVGMPLREGYRIGANTKKEVFEYFQLDQERQTFLIFGGSQGAQAINRLIIPACKYLLSKVAPFQVIHILGKNEGEEAYRQQYSALGIKACVKKFEENMHLAWQAASLVICRAGAGTIAEELEFEVPGILIPYPHGDNHQEKNGYFMSKKVKGAITLLEREINSQKLAEEMESLLQENGIKMNAMRLSMQQYKNEWRNKDLCALVKEIIERKNSGGKL